MADTNNVFISWSGERSKAAAEALREWLPIVLQAARPWMSETDIDKGSRGLDEVGRALEGMKIGIICLTPENLTADWILYEAGALSKTLDAKTRVCTYLLADLEPQYVKPPLGLFQATRANKDDTRKLVHAINKALDATPVPETNLNALFDGMWPRLEEKLAGLPAPDTIVQVTRPISEMVAEILELSRSAANSRKAVQAFDEYIPVLKQFMPALAQFIPIFTEAVKAAQKPAGLQLQYPPDFTPAPARKIFRVKLRDDAAAKRIEGANAILDALGRLVVLDDAGGIVARFADVEQWWPETLEETDKNKPVPSTKEPWLPSQ